MSLTITSSASDWSEVASEAFNPLEITGADDHFAGTLQAAKIGPDTTVCEITTAPSIVRRTRRGISQGDDSSIFLSLNLSDTFTIAQEDRVVHLQRNGGAFTASFLPYDLFCTGLHKQILLKIPRAAVPVARRSQLAVLARPFDARHHEMGFLRGYVESLLRNTALKAPDEVLRQTMLDLVALTIQSAVDEAVPSHMERTSLYHAMHSFIRTHAHDRSLTPQTIADRFLVSRRLVFQVFQENDTSPAAAIREERLRRAAFLLRSSDASISSIARQAGFCDLATFGRAFQREHGVTPSSWREAHRPA